MTDGSHDPYPLAHLDAHMLAAAESMPIWIPHLVRGFLDGLHRGTLQGAGQEFVAYRPYLPADPIRHVDWRVWARSDHLFVREFRHEAPLHATLLIDGSRSMDFGGGTANKFFHARILAAAAAWLVHRQHGAAGLGLLGAPMDAPDHWLRASRRSDHPHRLLDILTHTRAEGEAWTARPDTPPDAIGEFCGTRGLVAILTDGYGDPDTWTRLLEVLREREHRILFFHILSPAEIDPDLDDSILLVDAETGRELPLDGSAVRDAYTRNLETFRRELRNRCLDAEAEYIPLTTTDPLDQALTRFLRHIPDDPCS